MTNSERITSHNALIDEAIAKANALPDAGSGGGGVAVETCTVTIINNNEDLDIDVIGTWTYTYDGEMSWSSYPTTVFCEDSKVVTALIKSCVLFPYENFDHVTGDITQHGRYGNMMFIEAIGDCTITLK